MFEMKNLDECNFPFAIESVVLLGLSGSRAYGTDHSLSDYDYRGILIPPIKYTLSPFSSFEQFTWKSKEKSGRKSAFIGAPESEHEGTIFGIQKFIFLAAKANPNVLEMLFLRDEDYIYLSPEGKFLIENRDIFLSNRVLYSFAGYATSQLKRINLHRRWLLNPPERKPTRDEFGLPETKVISNEQILAAEKVVNQNIFSFAPWLVDLRNEHKEAFWEGIFSVLALLSENAGIDSPDLGETWVQKEQIAFDAMARGIGYDENFIQYLKQEKEYANMARSYKQYQAWKRNRNPARAKMEAESGFDRKHASHLARLLRSGEQLLKTGHLDVYRPDREWLLTMKSLDGPKKRLKK